MQLSPLKHRLNRPVSHSARHQRPLGKGTKFALHHGKCRQPSAAQYKFYTLARFKLTFKCGYNYFISQYTDTYSLHVTQIDLLHNNTFCSTQFARFRCKKGSVCVNSVMILVVLSTHAELVSPTAWGRSYWETGEQGGPVKLDSMWQHRLTRPLHVQRTYYRIIFKLNPFNIISRGVQGCTSTDFRLKYFFT